MKESIETQRTATTKDTLHLCLFALALVILLGVGQFMNLPHWWAKY